MGKGTDVCDAISRSVLGSINSKNFSKRELSRKLLAVYETEGLLLRLVVVLFYNPSVIFFENATSPCRGGEFPVGGGLRGPTTASAGLKGVKICQSNLKT